MNPLADENGNIKEATRVTLRYVLPLLLSLPAYAAASDPVSTDRVWQLQGPGISGSFTATANAITDWDITISPPGNSPSELLNKPCFIGEFGCELPIYTASIQTPTHLLFERQWSPHLSLSLDLFLSAPLGAEPNQFTSDFAYDYKLLHFQSSGVIAAPEPSSWVAIALGILAMLLPRYLGTKRTTTKEGEKWKQSS